MKKFIEVEGIDDAPVKIRHLSIGIPAMTVIKLIITNSLNLVHKKISANLIHTRRRVNSNLGIYTNPTQSQLTYCELDSNQIHTFFNVNRIHTESRII
jgi:hypothetical protein